MKELARTVAIVLTLASAACGGGGPGGHVNATSRVGPADVAARRTLLARFSPEGEAIVAAYEALPTRYELADGPYKVSSPDSFDGYFRDSAIENVVTYMTTGVHEMTHGYAGRMGFQVLADRGLPYGEGAVAFPGDDAALSRGLPGGARQPGAPRCVRRRR